VFCCRPREAIEGLGVDEICARTDTALDHFTQLEDQVGGQALYYCLGLRRLYR
jgi:hypothetical protein